MSTGFLEKVKERISIMQGMIRYVGGYIHARDRILFTAESNKEMISGGTIHIPELKKYSIITASINSFMTPIFMVKLKGTGSTENNFSGGSGFGAYTARLYLMYEGNDNYKVHLFSIRNVETGSEIDIANSIYKIFNIRGIEPDKDEILKNGWR